MTRRQFIKASSVALLNTVFLPQLVHATCLVPDRLLSLHNPHTGDRFTGVYWRQGHYLAEALTQINFLMRDPITHQVKAIDPRLLDLMNELYQQVTTIHPFQIICGYRSPATNAQLRRISSGVAEKSLHMNGQAVDLNIEGIKLSHLRDIACRLRKGGVGYYPRSGFIHIDIRPTPCTW